MELKQSGSEGQKGAALSYVQYSTFVVGERLYGIDVTRVQEVVRNMPMTAIPLAPAYVKGLINLRGQVATAIGLRELFGFKEPSGDQMMNVLCKCEGSLVSLLVDQIGDVIEVPKKDFERTPQTIDSTVRQYMSGVYKISGSLLSIIDIDKVSSYLSKAA